MKRPDLWDSLMIAVLAYGAYVAWDLWKLVYAQGK